MRTWQRFGAVGVLAAVITFGVGVQQAAAGFGLGIKGGPIWPNFGSADFNLDNKTGWQLGVFFDGGRASIFSLQAEVNWLRKLAETQTTANEVQIDYLQVPVMLRINIGMKSAAGIRFYGLAGATVSFRISDKVEGPNVLDPFEDYDVGAIFGGGMEVAMIIVEARWEKGFLSVNKNIFNQADIKSDTFAVLFGVRFK